MLGIDPHAEVGLHPPDEQSIDEVGPPRPADIAHPREVPPGRRGLEQQRRVGLKLGTAVVIPPGQRHLWQTVGGQGRPGGMQFHLVNGAIQSMRLGGCPEVTQPNTPALVKLQILVGAQGEHLDLGQFAPQQQQISGQEVFPVVQADASDPRIVIAQFRVGRRDRPQRVPTERPPFGIQDLQQRVERRAPSAGQHFQPERFPCHGVEAKQVFVGPPLGPRLDPTTDCPRQRQHCRLGWCRIGLLFDQFGERARFELRGIHGWTARGDGAAGLRPQGGHRSLSQFGLQQQAAESDSVGFTRQPVTPVESSQSEGKPVGHHGKRSHLQPVHVVASSGVVAVGDLDFVLPRCGRGEAHHHFATVRPPDRLGHCSPLAIAHCETRLQGRTVARVGEQQHQRLTGSEFDLKAVDIATGRNGPVQLGGQRDGLSLRRGVVGLFLGDFRQTADKHQAPRRTSPGAPHPQLHRSRIPVGGNVEADLPLRGGLVGGLGIEQAGNQTGRRAVHRLQPIEIRPRERQRHRLPTDDRARRDPVQPGGGRRGGSSRGFPLGLALPSGRLTLGGHRGFGGQGCDGRRPGRGAGGLRRPLRHLQPLGPLPWGRGVEQAETAIGQSAGEPFATGGDRQREGPIGLRGVNVPLAQGLDLPGLDHLVFRGREECLTVGTEGQCQHRRIVGERRTDQHRLLAIPAIDSQTAVGSRGGEEGTGGMTGDRLHPAGRLRECRQAFARRDLPQLDRLIGGPRDHQPLGRTKPRRLHRPGVMLQHRHPGPRFQVPQPQFAIVAGGQQPRLATMHIEGVDGVGMP